MNASARAHLLHHHLPVGVAEQHPLAIALLLCSCASFGIYTSNRWAILRLSPDPMRRAAGPACKTVWAISSGSPQRGLLDSRSKPRVPTSLGSLLVNFGGSRSGNLMEDREGGCFLMQKTVCAIHTGSFLIEVLKPLFGEILPGVRVVNLMDDGLLPDVRAAGGLTPSVVRRMLGYGTRAESAGAHAILNCCSSVGEAADLMRHAVSIPVVRIDRRMAREAVRMGRRVAVVASQPATLDPTERLVLAEAQLANRSVSTTRFLAPGAFDALCAGDAALHDQLVTVEIRRAAEGHDVILLAQGSMARIVPSVQPTIPVPLLASPRPGLLDLKEVLES